VANATVDALKRHYAHHDASYVPYLALVVHNCRQTASRPTMAECTRPEPIRWGQLSAGTQSAETVKHDSQSTLCGTKSRFDGDKQVKHGSVRFQPAASQPARTCKSASEAAMARAQMRE